ncbi:hypothetical protein N6L24_03595 [Cognatishimia sp. SS12]|uniref:hypothetical protein n=1 Tax=Cognatishimia sp. SS12 TaxID=2979465 RepID=UPI00232F9DCB|nr:hypothetical protein [Cognatishimia sp. SS12]MDC0737349.1 hypothetical protein [Cognatishimia sp. SS12]
MHRLAGKIVIVAGAATDLGWRLLPLFQSAGVRAILIDSDAEELIAMARRNPRQFEPLPVSRIAAQPFQQIGAIWGDEPLDLLIDLLPLGPHDRQGRLVSADLALLQGLASGLAAAKGRVISVIPKACAEDPVAYQIDEAGLCRITEVMGHLWAPKDVRINVLRPVPGASASDMAEAIAFLAETGTLPVGGLQIPIQSAAH